MFLYYAIRNCEIKIMTKITGHREYKKLQL